MLIKMGKTRQKRTNNHNVIVRNYEHYNKAFKKWDCPHGRYIGTKKDYERAMHEENMISEKEARDAGYTDSKRKDYTVTEDTLALIESVKQTRDSKGHIHPGDKAINRLRQKKANDYNRAALPAHYQTKGGVS